MKGDCEWEGGGGSLQGEDELRWKLSVSFPRGNSPLLQVGFSQCDGNGI
jgi:hypothetical protein